MLKHLRTSLVPFPVKPINDTQLVYVNHAISRSLTPSQILAFYSFISSGDEKGFAGESQFYADRYGGSGLMNNGGSGRCGFDGRFQLKGIGKTPLVGLGTPNGYSDGQLAMRDAIFEAASGEIGNHLLPHGSVRSAAIINLKTHNVSPNHPAYGRALLVREAPVRLAHFERASYFRPRPFIRSWKLPSDSTRTSQALDALPKMLCETFDLENYHEMTVEQIIIAGLTVFAKRLAQQIATAKSFRLMHGALSSSNVALDGRWLDLTSMTCLPLPGFGDLADYQPFWSEGSALMHSLKDIIYYLKKYTQKLSQNDVQIMSKLRTSYSESFAECYRDRIFELAGFPLVLSGGAANTSAFDKLFSILCLVYRTGFAVKSRAIPMAADNQVGALMLILTQFADSKTCLSRLNELLSSSHASSRLLSAYQDAREAVYRVANNMMIDISALTIGIRVNTLRLSRMPAIMYRPRLLAEIDTSIDTAFDDENLNYQIKEIFIRIDDHSEVCKPQRGLSLCLWKSRTHSVEYNILTGYWTITITQGNTAILQASDLATIVDDVCDQQLRSYYGPLYATYLNLNEI